MAAPAARTPARGGGAGAPSLPHPDFVVLACALGVWACARSAMTEASSSPPTATSCGILPKCAMDRLAHAYHTFFCAFREVARLPEDGANAAHQGLSGTLAQANGRGALVSLQSRTMIEATDGPGDRVGPIDLPNLDAFLGRLAPSGSRPRPLRKLHKILSRVDAKADLFAREDVLIQLAQWVRSGGEVPTVPGAIHTERGQTLRVRMLTHALTLFPEFRWRMCRLLQTLLTDQSAQSFFARMGIPGDRGLLSETIDRLSRRLMPQPIDEQDITQLVARMFPSKADPRWIAELPADVVQRLIEVLRGPDVQNPSTPDDAPRPAFATRGDLALGEIPALPEQRVSVPPASMSFNALLPLRIAVLDAILLLATRVSSAGLSDVIRARSAQKNPQDSPFYRLPRSIDMLLATRRRDAEEIALWGAECAALVQECREASRAVLAHLEETGVSVDVVYRLELIERSLRRIELLLAAIVPVDRTERARRVTVALVVLLQDRLRDLSLTDIVGTNTHMLARKVIERAGQTGEHYITTTPREWVMMFLSAAGGGIVIAFTTVIKFLIGHLHRPLMQEGILAGANYAASFLAVQFLGLTIATKQPSMTAAALAGALEKDAGNHRGLVTILARLVRSQIAAAVGNVLLVIPASFAVDLLWLKTRGAHLFEVEYAHKTLQSLHPTESGTIAFAALTGIILWLSSLVAGWTENWAVYRRLPEAIAEHRIRRYVGGRVMAWLSRVFARNIAGIGGNVSVGFMLGFTGVMGQFIGAPIEVRHVTLSAGSLTLAVTSLGWEAFGTPALNAALLGIVLILVLNLFVSFSAALSLALRARGVPVVQDLRLVGAIVAGFFRSPLRFLLPIEKAGEAAAGSAAQGHST